MEATALLERIREAGAELAVQVDGQFVIQAPKGKLDRDLVGDLRAHKSQLLELLAREAVAEYERLLGKVEELADAADAADAAGDPVRGAELEAEAIKLMNGEAGEVLEKMLAFGDTVLRKIRPLPWETQPAPRTVTVRLERCHFCGGLSWWWRKDGAQMCTVCHPASEHVEPVVLGVNSFVPGGSKGI